MRDAFRIRLGLWFLVGVGCLGLIGVETLVTGSQTLVHIFLFHLPWAFFLSAALACFWERSRSVTIRVAGGALLVSPVASIVYHASQPHF